MAHMSSRITRITLLAAVVLVGALLAGCGLLPGSGDTRSVSDLNNLFNFEVPAKWLVRTDEGVVTVYASDELPAQGEQPDALAVLVLSSREASGAPVPEMLEYLVDARAKSRGWTAVKKGEPQKTTVGGRPATYIDVSAKNAEGKQFESRYYFVRTDGSEAFVAAIAPAGKPIDSYDKDLEKITKMWYWYGAGVKASDQTTDTGRE